MSKQTKGGRGGPPAAALLEEDGELSAAFQAALGQIFARFDADGDGALSDAELNAFAAACNDGEPFSPEELEEVKELLHCDEQGRLTLRGFHELYATQTSARAEDTWHDLEALGYDRQLQRAGDAAAGAPAGAAAGGAHAAAPAAPAAAMDAALAACLPLVRAAKASRDGGEIDAARAALLAARGAAPASSQPLADRLLEELAALQPAAAAE